MTAYLGKILDQAFNYKSYITKAPWEIWWPNSCPMNELRGHTDRWILDYRAIRDVCEGFFDMPMADISMGYDVPLGATYDSIFGCFVRVNDSMSPRVANITIWHELTHVKQMREDDGRGLDEAAKVSARAIKTGDKKPYWENKWERDARANEPRGLEFPLVVEY